MRVLFVTKGYHGARGGAESAARDWFLRIRNVIDATILTDTPSTITEVLRRTSFSFLVSANPATFMRYAISMSHRLGKVCESEKPDLVHIHAFSGFVVIPPTDIPTVVTLHDEPFLPLVDKVSPTTTRFIYSSLRLMEDFMRGLMLSRDPFLHATGNTTAKLVARKFPRIECRCIPNPSTISNPSPPTKTKPELLMELGIPRNARVILTVGATAFRKGLHTIIDTAEEMRNERGIHFVVVGAATNFIHQSYLGKILERVRFLGLSNVHFTGFVDEDTLHNLYSHANLYLSTSLSEACNLSLIEAASYGIPIIATNVGAAKDLFHEEGVLISRNSTAVDIARAIRDNPMLPQVRYEAVGQMTEECVTKQLLDFYEYILNKRVR